ncbi:MAG TPA: NAD(P)/FAD-dependent oxidoreductase [Anaerolineales bacterium]|nr:NAD(P)/FAD-dependent oxidoreductase [Anaerolineales bacterium]
MANPAVIVVGAGIAGLTAAYQLKKAGMDVLVLDQNDYVGGRMANVDWEGFRVDIGAKFVTTADKSLVNMVRETGLIDQLIKSDEGLTITIYRNGKLHSANFLSIPSYLGWSGVSFKARMAMLKLVPHFLKLGKLENVYHLERAAGPDYDETFEQFFKEHISEEMFEYWAIPMFETMCAYKGGDVSRKAFLALMSSYLNADSVTFRDGIGMLPKALAASVEVELTAQVKSIRLKAEGSGARVTYTSLGQTKTVEAERIVVAVQGNYVLPILEQARPAWNAFFSKVAYSTGALHYHIAETDFQPPVRATFVPRSTKLPINCITFENFQDGRWLMLTDPNVYTFDMRQDPARLAEQAQEVMATIFPALKGTFRAQRIFKWQDKLPTFRPGYLEALKRFWEEPQEGPLYFCGDYFAGPSTGGALYTGMECAERVLKSI